MYIKSPLLIFPIEEIKGKDRRETRLLSITNYYRGTGNSDSYIDAMLLTHGFSVSEIEMALKQ